MAELSSKNFLSVVKGNEDLRHRLGSAVLTGTLPHALILEGPRGTGKHTVAKAVATALVCSAHRESRPSLPCMSCPECRKMWEGKSPDLVVVGCEEKATIGVETARFIREDVRIIPNDSDHKIYIIEDADRMTTQAQNALLLTLEEPPSYARFFLLCENASLLLQTIRSRAPIFRTQPLTRTQIADYLCDHDLRAKQMRLSDPAGFAELIAASGTGIGQALIYLEPKAYAPVKQMRELIAELIRCGVEKRSADVVIPLLNRLSPKRDLLRIQLTMLADGLRDLIVLKKSEQIPLCFYAGIEQAIELCDRTSLSFLYRMYEAARKAQEENAANMNTKLLITKLAVTAELI